MEVRQRGGSAQTAVVLCSILLLCSCSAGSGQSPDPQLPEPFPAPIVDGQGLVPGGLPPPSALKLSAEYEAAYFCPAAAYREDWPNLRVYTYFNSSRILLYPDYYQANSVAYACYSLNTAGLELDNRLRVKISRTDKIWVGVADFVQDTWRWQRVVQSYSYPYDEEPQIAVATFDPETSIRSSQLPVILLAYGTNTEVEWLNLHSEIPPMINDVGIWGSKEGQLARLSPDLSMGIPEWIIWDFSTAGIPNYSFELEPGLILGAPGTYSCSVKAGNDSGSNDYEFELTVEPQHLAPSITLLPRSHGPSRRRGDDHHQHYHAAAGRTTGLHELRVTGRGQGCLLRAQLVQCRQSGRGQIRYGRRLEHTGYPARRLDRGR